MLLGVAVKPPSKIKHKKLDGFDHKSVTQEHQSVMSRKMKRYLLNPNVEKESWSLKPLPQLSASEDEIEIGALLSR